VQRHCSLFRLHNCSCYILILYLLFEILLRSTAVSRSERATSVIFSLKSSNQVYENDYLYVRFGLRTGYTYTSIIRAENPSSARSEVYLYDWWWVVVGIHPPHVYELCIYNYAKYNNTLIATRGIYRCRGERWVLYMYIIYTHFAQVSSVMQVVIFFFIFHIQDLWPFYIFVQNWNIFTVRKKNNYKILWCPDDKSNRLPKYLK